MAIVADHLTEWQCLCHRWLYADPAHKAKAAWQEADGDAVVCVCGERWTVEPIHDDRWSGLEEAHLEAGERNLVLRKALSAQYDVLIARKAAVHAEEQRLSKETSDDRRSDRTILDPLRMHVARDERAYNDLLRQVMS